MEKINPQFVESIRDNQKVRQRLGYEDPLLFSLLYLKHHFSYPLAPFHLEMFHLIRQAELNLIVVMAFRESGKSTVLNTTNVLWSILGKPGKKFVIVMSKTQEQAKNHFANIKAELTDNQWLKEDFGPFAERPEEWSKLSLELEYHGAKILSVTRDQSVRGLKYGAFRPDLIICDDLEDAESVKITVDGQALYERFQSEILPLGNENTRIVVLGNLVSFFHEDELDESAFLLHLRSEVLKGKVRGLFRGYPLIDSCGRNLWPGRFPTQASLRKLRLKLPQAVWIREYLLKVYGQGDGPNFHFYGDGEKRKRDYLIEIFEENGLPWSDGEVPFTNLPPQTPLIKQMRKFTIRAPVHPMIFFAGPDDPACKRYINKMHIYDD